MATSSMMKMLTHKTMKKSQEWIKTKAHQNGLPIAHPRKKKAIAYQMKNIAHQMKTIAHRKLCKKITILQNWQEII